MKASDGEETLAKSEPDGMNKAPLANGEVRRQLGLKLRAHDTCNVVYVMWHVEPTPGIYVSVKHNLGQSTHSECGDHGYTNLKPEVSAPVAALHEGEQHSLRAWIEGSRLIVSADGAVVWKGQLPSETWTFDGPVGLRSDNAIFDVRLTTL